MGILNKNILFVQSGIPFYYPSLEMSIYNALKKAVQTVTIVSTSKEAIKNSNQNKTRFHPSSTRFTSRFQSCYSPVKRLWF